MSEREDQSLKYRLIELVRDEPMQWNQRDPIYKTKKPNVKNLKWATFAGQLGLPDESAVRSLWKTLRDQFAREAEKIPRFFSGMEAPDNYDLYTSWQFFTQLLFLRHTICAKRGSGNLEHYESSNLKELGGHGNMVDAEIVDVHKDIVDEDEFTEKPCDSSDWRLFIDSSCKSLKAVLLNNVGNYPSLPIAHSSIMKEDYTNVKTLLEFLEYSQYSWDIISDFKMIAFLRGLQNCYIKFQCYLCEWDSRADDKHFTQRFWPAHKLVKGQPNVKNDPLVDLSKILIPPLHLN